MKGYAVRCGALVLLALSTMSPSFANELADSETRPTNTANPTLSSDDKELQQRGKQLRTAIERKYKELAERN
jgi:hypothetical protein